jgi:hypothetical protein
MLVNLKRFNGITLNVSGIKAVVLNPGMMPKIDPVFIAQSQADQDYSGAYSVDLRSVAVQLGITDNINFYARMKTLKGWFKRGARGTLESTFSDDGLDYLLNCVVVTPPIQDKDFPNLFTAILQTGDSAWRAVTADTSSWTVSGAGGTKAITVEGNDETRLSLDITPTAGPSTGYLYQKLYRLPSVPAVNYGVRPWCLTIDHAALVTAGKSQADGDDLRIWLGDYETKRWIAGANTAATKIWFNLTIPAGYSLKLLTAVPASGSITTLQFEKTADVKNRITAMPASGIVYHNNEWFYYGSKDAAAYRLNNITRKLYGTTEEAHTVGVTFSFISQPIYLAYGNTSVGSPSADDETYDNDKPLFNLSSSDNTKWVYDATSKFYDPQHPGRPGEWKQFVKRNALNLNAYVYNVKGDAESGDPALGARGANYRSGTISKSDVLELSLSLYCAGGFSVVSATGRKYRSSSLFLSKAAFQRSADGKSWYDLWNETSPSAAGVFENWGTHTSVAVATGSKYLRQTFLGTFGASPADAYALCEGLTATCEFTSANLPTGTLLAESNNCQLTAIVANNTNSDSLTIDLPLLANKLLAMDGELNTAVYDGSNVHRSILLNDEGRSAWLRLTTGTNTISITGTDIGTLSVVLKWYRRRLH